MACNERVGKGIITYPCTLPDGHNGPHRATRAAPASASVPVGRRPGQPGSGTPRPAWPSSRAWPRRPPSATPRTPPRCPVSAGRARLHCCLLPGACLVYDGDYCNRISAWRECPYNPPPPGYGRPTEDVPVDVSSPAARRPSLRPRTVVSSSTPTPVSPGCTQRVATSRSRSPRPSSARATRCCRPGTSPPTSSRGHRRHRAPPPGRHQRYGTALQPFNGRKTLLDAYEESLDLSIYLRSLLTMQQADRERMVDAVTDTMYEAVGIMFTGDTGSKVSGAATPDERLTGPRRLLGDPATDGRSLVVDGNNILIRAVFAARASHANLATEDGVPTAALHVFIQTAG